MLPIHPRAERERASACWSAGVKGSKAPLRIAAARSALHEASGAFTALAEAIHRGEAMIDWQAVKPRVDPR